MARKLEWKDRHLLNRETPLFKRLKMGDIVANGWGKAKIAQGQVSFSGTNTTVNVPALTLEGEALSTIYGGFVCYVDEPSAAVGFNVPKVTSGTGANTVVTVKRVGDTTSGAEISYLLIGE